MSLCAIRMTIGQSLGDGRYDSSLKGGSSPDIATILTDITAALTAAGGSHDSTPEITTVQTDATALTDSINADLTVIWDQSKITDCNQLQYLLQQVRFAAKTGIGGLT